MARFKPIESVSDVWTVVLRDPGFVAVRTLVYVALAIALGVVVFAFVVIVFGGSILAAIAQGSAEAFFSTLLSGVSLYVIAGVALVVGLLAWYVASSIGLGFIVSMFRLTVDGKARYDLFAGFARTVQFMLFGLLFALIYLALGGIAYSLILVQPVLGVVFAVLAGLALIWFAFQWVFVPVRIAVKGENAVRAMLGSSRMLAGSRWTFALTLLVLVVAFSFVQAILSIVPILGALASMVLSFASEPFFVLWLSTSYQQLEPIKKLR